MNGHTRIAGVVLVLLTTFITSSRAACSYGTQREAVTQALELRRSLLALDVVWDGPPFPASSSERFEQFKAALIRVADLTMACEATGTAPAALQKHLALMLHANRPQPPQKVSDGEDMYKPEKGILTGDLRVRVKPALTSLRLFTVEFNFGLECGFDSILIVYEQTPEGWKDVLRWRSRNIEDVLQAFGDFFDYAVLPGDGGETWRVVALHGSPWCTSNMSEFTIDLLAASSNADNPKVVQSVSREYRRWEQPKFSTQGNIFTLRTEVDNDESDIMTRKAIFRYQLHGDHLRRIAPIATTGSFFVNEWLQMPWGEASGFSKENTLEALEAMHDRYEKNAKKKDTYVEYIFGPVRACHDNSKHFQVQMNETREKEKATPLFFSILENGSGYTMLATSAQTDTRCDGPNLAKQN